MRKKNLFVPACPVPDEEVQIDAEIKRKARLVKRLKKDVLIKIAVSAAAAFVTFNYVFGVALAPTNDMFPAVHKGDLVIFYRPGRIINTDVVIYETPEGMQIGRVEGTQGETVGRTDGGLLTVNDNIQPIQKRSGLYDETYAGERDISGEIGQGDFLILGDRRETAEDSRSFGLISHKAIKGKIFTIIRRRPL